jgi:hypothetical protein
MLLYHGVTAVHVLHIKPQNGQHEPVEVQGVSFSTHQPQYVLHTRCIVGVDVDIPQPPCARRHPVT